MKSDAISTQELMLHIELQTQLMQSIQKEIFENINQILYGVRLKLSSIDLREETKTEEYLRDSGNLLGQAIIELRNLAKQLRDFNGNRL